MTKREEIEELFWKIIRCGMAYEAENLKNFYDEGTNMLELEHYIGGRELAMRSSNLAAQELIDELSNLLTKSNEEEKTWYFEGDELVIKKGKWVIDRYKKHIVVNHDTLKQIQEEAVRGFVETLKLNKHIFYTKGLGKEIQEEADIYLTQQSLDKGDGE